MSSPRRLELGESHREREGRGGVAEHPRQLLLDQLEPADRPAELLPLERVGEGRLVRPDLHAGGVPADHVPQLREDRRDVGERVDALQPRRLRHPHVVEHDVAVVHHAQRDLAADLGDRHPGRLARNEEHLDAIIRRVFRDDRAARRRVAALPIQRLWPVMRHSSPSRVATVSMPLATSDPWSGSVSAKHPVSSNDGMRGSSSATCSGDPPSRTTVRNMPTCPP